MDAKVLRGETGRLFLDNDTNDVLSQHSGALRFSQSQLRQWRFVLETRIAWLEKLGAEHHFVVAPNAHSVYDDELPDIHAMSDRRPILQLVDFLADQHSFASIIYPLDDLVAQRERQVFGRTETHWSELGAFFAYRRLVSGIGADCPMRAISEEDLHIYVTEKAYVGDLGSKVVPNESSPLLFVDVRASAAELVSDNRVMNQGRRIQYRCPDAPDVKCLVYGDSFSIQMLPYLAETFGETVFAHIPTLDYDLVEREQPGIVIFVMNERFLISVPNDLGAPTLDELAAEKEAAGRIYPPRTWTGTRIDSPTPGVGSAADLQAEVTKAAER